MKIDQVIDMSSMLFWNAVHAYHVVADYGPAWKQAATADC